jgi:signal transduction histidine kinase
MKFRTRALLLFLLAVLLPMISLVWFVRQEMTERLTAQYRSQVESMADIIEQDLAGENEAVGASLKVLRSSVVDDNRFRRAAVDQIQTERKYLLDYAGRAMQLAGLSMLQIQDQSGRIISSGHFRNEYDRLEPRLPMFLSSLGGRTVLVKARAPEGPFPALARIDSFEMGNRKFTIIAGYRIEERFLRSLAGKQDMRVELITPVGPPAGQAGSLASAQPDEMIQTTVELPYFDPTGEVPGVAVFQVTHDLTGLKELRRSMDRWFLIAVAAAAMLAVLLAGYLAARISRPLISLANKTARIDMDRLDIDFESSRRDEIGALSRLLGDMTGRLRAGAKRIKEAERQATIGELARQVNHDIKNGLTPIRNVLRHLFQLAADKPAELPEVFKERRDTLDAGVSYLEALASNYAKLHPPVRRELCDVNRIIRRVGLDYQDMNAADLRLTLAEQAVVTGDPVALRRVIENLLANAIDSLGSEPGRLELSTALVDKESGQKMVRITVNDSGAGMTEEQQARLFDDFYTTKPGGTGLGLSIVRRLVMDLDGTIEVESQAGRGSRFVVDLPAGGEV